MGRWSPGSRRPAGARPGGGSRPACDERRVRSEHNAPPMQTDPDVDLPLSAVPASNCPGTNRSAGSGVAPVVMFTPPLASRTAGRRALICRSVTSPAFQPAWASTARSEHALDTYADRRIPRNTRSCGDEVRIGEPSGRAYRTPRDLGLVRSRGSVPQNCDVPCRSHATSTTWVQPGRALRTGHRAAVTQQLSGTLLELVRLLRQGVRGAELHSLSGRVRGGVLLVQFRSRGGVDQASLVHVQPARCCRDHGHRLA